MVTLTLALMAVAGCIADPSSVSTSAVQQAATFECQEEMELAGGEVIEAPTELCGGDGGGTPHDPASDPCSCYYARERCTDDYDGCQRELDRCKASCVP